MPVLQLVSCSIVCDRRISFSVVTDAHFSCTSLLAGVLLLSCSHSQRTHRVLTRYSPCSHHVLKLQASCRITSKTWVLQRLSHSSPVADVSCTCCNFFMLLDYRGQLWGSLRAGAQPMFHSANLSTYAGTINKAVDALITKLHTIARSGREVNIFQPLGQMTLQVTGVAAFGWVYPAHSCLSPVSKHMASACKQDRTSQLLQHHDLFWRMSHQAARVYRQG